MQFTDRLRLTGECRPVSLFVLDSIEWKLTRLSSRLSGSTGSSSEKPWKRQLLAGTRLFLSFSLVLEEIADPEIAADLNADGDYMAHLYAMFLLAQFRETRAYPLMVRIALLPRDLLESLFGDCITEDFGRVLASVCDGNLEGIQSIIENPAADEWVRGAALGLWCLLSQPG